MQDSRSSRAGGSVRRWVPGAALVMGAMLAIGYFPDDVLAADRAPALVVAQTGAATATAPSPAGAAKDAPAQAVSPANAAAAQAGDAASKAKTPGDDDERESEDILEGKDGLTFGDHGIVIQKGGRRVRIDGIGRDREYDSFEQFVQDAPWLAGLVFFTVSLVFLVPMLIIVLLIWYKIRKNRMANETMLKLAERGVVPPTAAMDAVATGNAAPLAEAATAMPSSVPAYEHARALHRRTAWSDLRKGVILSGIGLGLTFWSLLDDGTPNGPGLIFLFVGIGYGILWYFEDRTRSPQRDAPVTPPREGA